MNNIEKIENIERISDFEIPIMYDSDSKFESILREKLDLYSNFVGNLKIDSKIRKSVALDCKQIPKIINYYLKADVAKAIRSTKTILDKFKHNSLFFTKYENAHKSINNISYSSYLFKGRVESNTKITEEGMFHIPFNQREIIKSQRYSIPGIPCIYLGESSYTVWRELGEPAEELLNVCIFELEKSLKLINLAYSSNDILELNNAISETNIQKINEILKIYPLIIACSMKNEKSDRNFKVEYIFPQLIMMNLEHLNCDGIVYHSNKVGSSFCSYLSRCYAFPAYFDDSWNNSNLKFKMRNSSPINFKEFLLYNNSMAAVLPANSQKELITNYHRDMIYFAGRIMRYNDTIFFKFDNYLISNLYRML
ncbi:hypothetical protein [Breznakia pachnodae]|uniref:RES domain-containing protein n=1 Tax=Breznakia pachnodae TaxID=265178 RepID=A0ABU0E480_9FIRM|nr:hypothetical protein [Breznakia pachnodae]MDQ0361521.1 hypothetical protein [Breznakia pachnodae]